MSVKRCGSSLFRGQKGFRRNKKGILFIVDVLIGFTIIVVGLMMLVSYYYDVPNASQSSYYSDDFLRFLTTTEFGEFQTNYSRTLIKNEVVLGSESIGSGLSKFCGAGNYSAFNGTIINSLDIIADGRELAYSVNVTELNGTSTGCYYDTGSKRNQLKSPLRSVSRSLIMAYANNNYSFIGPYVLEVRVW